MIKNQTFRIFWMFFIGTLLTVGMSSCWSARCPRETCRVRVEHRHGESYYRPREAFSWMWTPRYKHVRTSNYATIGPNKPTKKRAWYQFYKPADRVSSKKPR
ncbi:hypothetical protein [Aquirufa salirivi]|uniref:Uncharacterized protein n=1 Tax=Aquirufa salirivi TaxID=3104729 RepID=A0ABW8RY66_9BACT